MTIAPVRNSATAAADDGGRLFTQPAYLDALERSGCAAPPTGWRSRRSGALAAGPWYEKSHSWGEFVFDFAWAEAHHALGLPYYPRLVCAVPFTPVPGPRVGSPAAAEAVEHEVAGRKLSSAHVLFANAADAALLTARGWLARPGLRFVWRNQGYGSFDDFLGRLASKKRKNIRRDRLGIREANADIRWRCAAELADAEWGAVFRLYARTYRVRGQQPYLNEACLRQWAAAYPAALLLCECRVAGELFAVAFCFRDGDTLYGRHWGCARDVDGLHFELCYYRGIEYCIAHGLARFDAGVQGEHKLLRGFDPELDTSLHWLRDPRLRAAIAEVLSEETAFMAAQLDEAQAHSAYRR